eukprot:6174161-Pleurochrysis_carterae.AAC.2
MGDGSEVTRRQAQPTKDWMQIPWTGFKSEMRTQQGRSMGRCGAGLNLDIREIRRRGRVMRRNNGVRQSPGARGMRRRGRRKSLNRADTNQLG